MVDPQERPIALDPAFCRAMQLDAGQLLNGSLALLVGVRAFEEFVQPALRRCFAGAAATHQLVLTHPTLGLRQVSVTYHPCAQADGSVPYCALILRDVTSEKLANDGFVLYSQWREALNAIDRASLSDQPLRTIATLALDRLRNLTPYRHAWLIVSEELARAAALELHTATLPASAATDGDFTGDFTGNSVAGARLVLMASVPPGPLPLDADGAVRLRLQVQNDYIGELVLLGMEGQPFGPGQLEMMRELANRLERVLHKTLLREKLNRYTFELENAVAERTQEIERRRQAAEGLREILGFLNANRPLVEILNHIFRQAELLLGADAIAVFRPLSVGDTALLAERCIFAHSRSTGSVIDSVTGNLTAADLAIVQPAVTQAVAEARAVTLFAAQPPSRYPAQLVVPMLAEQSVLGVIIFFFAAATDLAPESLDLAVALGEQVVLATESAVLQQRAQEATTLEERERLARELHDAVTQSIYSLTLFAEAGRRLASAGQLERVQEYLTLLGDTAQQAMKQMRLMLYELRPTVLEQVGLVQALRNRLDAVERRAGIDARLEVSEPLRLAPAVEEGLYRICQEALNNALKHASARNVIVRLRHSGDVVTLEVSDDGVGFVHDQQGEPAGLGLNHIRERAARLNAALEIETAPDRGATIRISLHEPAANAAWLTTDGITH